MEIYMPPSIRHFEPRWMVTSVWVDHAPFGYDLVNAVKPRLMVELGTYRGMSYFTFCQSVKDHGLDTLAYAVDTWQGDAHVEAQVAYDEKAYDMVAAHNREHYSGFSYLMRMTFNEALNTFGNETIDLLHIDGYHTYDAVSEDFNNWLPKVAPGGVILFHDITARTKSDFGVWKLWDEVSPHYESFAFYHGYGLGVIRKPGGASTDAPLLNLLFSEAKAGEKEKLRAFYVHAANYFSLERRIRPKETPKAQAPALPQKDPSPPTENKPLLHAVVGKWRERFSG